MSWNHRKLSLWHSKGLPEAIVVSVKKKYLFFVTQLNGVLCSFGEEI